LKNQINILNLRLSKEVESRQQTEDALKKNNEKFSVDAEKYTSSLKSINKDNEQLALKLQEADKNL